MAVVTVVPADTSRGVPMTTTHPRRSHPGSGSPRVDDRRDPTREPLADPQQASRPLRLVLRANAAFSLLSGIVVVVAHREVDELLGLDLPLLVVAVGVGLVAFGVIVAGIAGSPPRQLRTSALAVSGADAAWVVGTVVVVAGGVVDGGGAAVLGVVGTLVAGFGTAQLVTRRRLLDLTLRRR
jgi:hypothetical protein